MPGPRTQRRPHFERLICGSIRRGSLSCAAWAILTATGPVLAGSPFSAQCEAEGDGFRVIVRDHFVICSDVDDRLARQLGIRLEATYTDAEELCSRNGIEPNPLAGPLEVFFFEYPDNYHRYASTVEYESQGTLGFFHADTNRSAFFNSENDPRLDAVKKQIAEAREALDESEVKRLRALLMSYESQINQMVVQHESAHQVLYNLGVHNPGSSNPPWLVEGLACLFEPAPTREGAGFGATNRFRLYDFREALRDGRARRNLVALDFDRAVEEQIMVPLDTLITDPDIWKAPAAQANNYYAQAWALAHYLQHEHAEEWAAYIKKLAARSPQRLVGPHDERRDFEASFGPIDEEFTREWATYILRLKAPQVIANIH